MNGDLENSPRQRNLKGFFPGLRSKKIFPSKKSQLKSLILRNKIIRFHSTPAPSWDEKNNQYHGVKNVVEGNQINLTYSQNSLLRLKKRFFLVGKMWKSGEFRNVRKVSEKTREEKFSLFGLLNMFQKYFIFFPSILLR